MATTGQDISTQFQEPISPLASETSMSTTKKVKNVTKSVLVGSDESKETKKKEDTKKIEDAINMVGEDGGLRKA